MAISRERRTALAELMVATARLQTVKAMLKDDSEDAVAIETVLRITKDSIDRAMVALKS